MPALVRDLLRSPMNWLLVFVPAVLVLERASPDAHTALFLLSVLAIVPLAGLLSHATEADAEWSHSPTAQSAPEQRSTYLA